MTRIFLCFLAGVLGLIFAGCSAIQGHGDSLSNFESKLYSNECNYADVDKKINDKNDVILWGIQGGSFAFNCNEYAKSIEYFDKAEDIYRDDVDLKSFGASVADGAKSIMVNNNVNEYEGYVYERIMVNIYKGINFLFLKDSQNARIEFNRALDRQRRAKEYFESEIKKTKEELDKDQNAQIAQNEQTLSVVNEAYASDFDFKAYPDFINPFATYMSGLFFYLDKDYGKAADLFREVRGMDKDNKIVQADFRLANQMANSTSKRAKKHHVWVIYENGRSMAKDEFRLDLPIFLVSKNVFYTGIALPKMVARNSSYPNLYVANGGDVVVKTQEVASMDNVMMTEFKKRLPIIVTEAIISTVAKTVVQKQLNDSADVVGGLVGALYQGLTNRADVRSWRALPKSFQVARVEIGKSPIIVATQDGRIILNEVFSEQNNAIIYVKSPQESIDVVHTVIFD